MAAQLVNGRLNLGGDGAAVAAVGHKGRSGCPAPEGGHLSALPCAGLPCHCHHIESVALLPSVALCDRHTGHITRGTDSVN